MAAIIERQEIHPSIDQVRTVCEALRASYGEHVYAFVDRQLGVASGEALARWLAITGVLKG